MLAFSLSFVAISLLLVSLLIVAALNNEFTELCATVMQRDCSGGDRCKSGQYRGVRLAGSTPKSIPVEDPSGEYGQCRECGKSNACCPQHELQKRVLGRLVSCHTPNLPMQVASAGGALGYVLDVLCVHDDAGLPLAASFEVHAVDDELTRVLHSRGESGLKARNKDYAP
jgi:hypothetical protein